MKTAIDPGRGSLAPFRAAAGDTSIIGGDTTRESRDPVPGHSGEPGLSRRVAGICASSDTRFAPVTGSGLRNAPTQSDANRFNCSSLAYLERRGLVSTLTSVTSQPIPFRARVAVQVSRPDEARATIVKAAFMRAELAQSGRLGTDA